MSPNLGNKPDFESGHCLVFVMKELVIAYPDDSCVIIVEWYSIDYGEQHLPPPLFRLALVR